MWLRAEGRKGGFWRSVESGSSVERIDKCMYRERAMEGRRKEESTIRVLQRKVRIWRWGWRCRRRGVCAFFVCETRDLENEREKMGDMPYI